MDDRRQLRLHAAPAFLVTVFATVAAAGFLACQRAGHGGPWLAAALVVAVLVHAALIQHLEDRYGLGTRKDPEPQPPVAPRP